MQRFEELFQKAQDGTLTTKEAPEFEELMKKMEQEGYCVWYF